MTHWWRTFRNDFEDLRAAGRLENRSLVVAWARGNQLGVLRELRLGLTEACFGSLREITRERESCRQLEEGNQ